MATSGEGMVHACSEPYPFRRGFGMEQQRSSGCADARPRLPRLLFALAAAGLLTATSVTAAIISDVGHEPGNDVLAGAEVGTAVDTFVGCIGIACDQAHQNVGGDPADFIDFTGLVNAGIYRLNLLRFIESPNPPTMVFDLYFNGHTSIDQSASLTGITPAGNVPNLTGLTSLAVGIHLGAGQSGLLEGYNVSLTRTGTAAVPEPASIALVAAGLAGAFATRRKKRV